MYLITTRYRLYDRKTVQVFFIDHKTTGARNPNDRMFTEKHKKKPNRNTKDDSFIRSCTIVSSIIFLFILREMVDVAHRS